MYFIYYIVLDFNNHNNFIIFLVLEWQLSRTGGFKTDLESDPRAPKVRDVMMSSLRTKDSDDENDSEDHDNYDENDDCDDDDHDNGDENDDGDDNHHDDDDNYDADNDD